MRVVIDDFERFAWDTPELYAALVKELLRFCAKLPSQKAMGAVQELSLLVSPYEDSVDMQMKRRRTSIAITLNLDIRSKHGLSETSHKKALNLVREALSGLLDNVTTKKKSLFKTAKTQDDQPFRFLTETGKELDPALLLQEFQESEADLVFEDFTNPPIKRSAVRWSGVEFNLSEISADFGFLSEPDNSSIALMDLRSAERTLAGFENIWKQCEGIVLVDQQTGEQLEGDKYERARVHFASNFACETPIHQPLPSRSEVTGYEDGATYAEKSWALKAEVNRLSTYC